MLEGKYLHTMVSHRNELFIVGGRLATTKKSINTSSVYSKKDNLWKELPNLNYNKVEVGAAVLGNYLYAFGGCRLP